MFLFKQYSKALQVVIPGFFLVFFALQNNAIRETSEWVLNRYGILLSSDVDFRSEIEERNLSIHNGQKQNKDLFFQINGFGLGGPITPTESDFYNTYSYFGVIGSSVYYLFIVYCAIKIYLNWKYNFDPAIKDIGSISFLISVIMPLYGLQQWYIMTYGSNNAVNNYFILFILAIALRRLNVSENELKSR